MLIKTNLNSEDFNRDSEILIVKTLGQLKWHIGNTKLSGAETVVEGPRFNPKILCSSWAHVPDAWLAKAESGSGCEDPAGEYRSLFPSLSEEISKLGRKRKEKSFVLYQGKYSETFLKHLSSQLNKFLFL